ncbi:MAG: hypothetical protein HQL73_10040 [Magnetococcales bacterium]|nr:hypothetical protein [Magnetococcales bacterium]
MNDYAWRQTEAAIMVIHDQLRSGLPVELIPPPEFGKLHLIGYLHDGTTVCFYISSERAVTRWKVGTAAEREEKSTLETRATIFRRSLATLLPVPGCRRLLIYLRQDFGFTASGIQVELDSAGSVIQVSDPQIMD